MRFMDETPVIRFESAHKISRSEFYGRSFHNRGHWALSIRLSGEAHFQFGDRTETIRRGDVLLFSPDVTYVQVTQREEIIALHFQVLTPCSAEYEKMTPADPETAEKYFRRILTEYREKKPGWYCRAASLLYRIFAAEAARDDSAAESPNEAIDRAEEYIRANALDPELKAENIIAASGCCASYLRKKYAERFHRSPWQRVTELRLAAAKQYLESGEGSVAEIANRCGFADPKYFSTWFRRETGFPPGKYAESICG